MKAIFKHLIIVSLVLVLIGSNVSAQDLDLTDDPTKVKICYDDLENFLVAFKKIDQGADLAETLKVDYLDKASPALKNYMQDTGYSLKDFVERFDSYKESYATLPGAPKQLKAQEESIRSALQDMKNMLPEAMFLPLYYMVGISGGMFAEPSETGIRLAMSRLADDDHLRRLKLLVVHESVHVQQFLAIGPEAYFTIYGNKQSILAVSIREGTAEYLTRLICGDYTNPDVYAYAKKNENRIWERFESEMHNREFGDWLFATPKNPDQPKDLGYIVGALIVGAFYENAEDKDMAIKEILSITDSDSFLVKSGYAEKFAR